MNNYKNRFFRACTFALFLFLAHLASAQELLKVADWDKSAGFIQMKANTKIEPLTFFAKYGKDLGLGEHDEMVLLREEADNIGMKHYRFQQKHKGIEVEHATMVVHAKGGYVVSVNGSFVINMQQNKVAMQTEETALQTAIAFLGKKQYSWENKLPISVSNPNDSTIKRGIWESEQDSIMANMPRKTEDITENKPKGELVYTFRDNVVMKEEHNKVLAYRFPIYFYEENRHLEGFEVYVDAKTGEIIKSQSLVHNCNGQLAQTNQQRYGNYLYIETQGWEHWHWNCYWSWSCWCTRCDHVCDYWSWDLDDNCQGFEIKTTDQNGTMFSINSSCGYVPTWTVGYSDYTTAHWAAKNTYNYFLNSHGLNGYNGSGSGVLEIKMIPGFANAGAASGVSRLEIGYNATYLGQTNITFATLDALGHEYTHKVIESELGTVPLTGEAGGVQESMADIFATMSEFYKLGSGGNYWIGEDIDHNPNTPNLRDMSNPNAFLQPDTYNGTYWDPTNYDPHTNSGVQNFWFYLLAEGGNGTNDNGDAYCVQGIGKTAAAAIAYRNLTVYLTSTSNYAEARFYALQSAQDLYGVNSFEAQQTAAAWYAVGVYSSNAVTLNTNNAYLCANGTATISGTITGATTAPYTITLYNMAGIQIVSTTSNTPAYNFNYSPITSGDYYVIANDNAGNTIYYEKCPLHIAVFSMGINTYSTGATNCLNDNMQIEAIVNGGLSPFTYSWNFNNQSYTTPSIQANLAAGTYLANLTVTTANGCVASTNDTLVVNPYFCGNPAFSPTVNGNLISLNAADNIAFASWEVYDNNSGGYIGSYPLDSTSLHLPGGDYIIYHVMYDCDSNFCNYTYQYITTCDPLQVTITGNNPICAGTSTTYTANVTGGNGGYTYSWNLAGQTGNSITVSPTTNKTYTVYVTAPKACATVSATINVIVNTLPVVTITGPTTFCTGGTAFLTANCSTAVSYQWYKIGTSNLIAGATNSTYTPTVSGNHYVKVVDANGCTKQSTNYNVTVNASPPANAGADKTVCEGTKTKIGVVGNAAYTYTWSPTNGLATPLKDTSSCITSVNRTYILTVTNPNTGCSRKDTMYVIANPLPAIPVIALNGTNPTCAGAGTTLSTAVGMTSYQWNTGVNAISGATSNTYTPTVSGNHRVIVTDINGCSRGSSNYNIIVNPAPPANAGANKTICAGSPVSIGITNNNAYTYSWSPGLGLSDSLIANPQAFPMDTTQYVLTVTNGNNCSKKG